MRAGEALKVLRVTRQTLCSYVRNGLIKADRLPSGQYEYQDESVFGFLNKDVKRKTVLYGRVSTPKQRKDLTNQVEQLKEFSFKAGWIIDQVYQDIASGISFEKRKDFFLMLEEIINNKVARVIITYKDRLSRVGFELFSYLFKKYGTEIVVISEVGSAKLDSAEIFEEIVSLLHCYSMKLYSSRRRKVITELCSPE
jgi:predicted site-specific integrase-resolvase